MDKIWLVVEDDDCCIKTDAFGTKEKAEEVFAEKKEKALEYATEDEIRVNEDTCLEIYEEGCYSDGHYALFIRELEVK